MLNIWDLQMTLPKTGDSSYSLSFVFVKGNAFAFFFFFAFKMIIQEHLLSTIYHNYTFTQLEFISIVQFLVPE